MESKFKKILEMKPCELACFLAKGGFCPELMECRCGNFEDASLEPFFESGQVEFSPLAKISMDEIAERFFREMPECEIDRENASERKEMCKACIEAFLDEEIHNGP